MRMKNKVTVVVGGSSGIGFGIAKVFAREGATVIGVGRDAARLEQFSLALGPSATGIRADVTREADIRLISSFVRGRAGHIDTLVVSVGVAEFAPLGKITQAHFDRIFDTHVKATVFTVQGLLPLLADGASVILLSSSAGAMGTPAFSVYSAAKAAVRSFARCWILDLQPRRIRVNVLSPGPVQTEGLAALAPPGQASHMFRSLASRIPAGRIGQPEDVANAALFLASPESSFVNGVELAVDGGMAQI